VNPNFNGKNMSPGPHCGAQGHCRRYSGLASGRDLRKAHASRLSHGPCVLRSRRELPNSASANVDSTLRDRTHPYGH